MKSLPLLACALLLSGCALFPKKDAAPETSESAPTLSSEVNDEDAAADPSPSPSPAPDDSPTPTPDPASTADTAQAPTAPGAPREGFFSRIWHSIFPKKNEAPPAATTPRWVGTIRVISDADNYVLIDSQPFYALSAGTILHSVGGDSETATLRVSGESNPPFFIADIVNGNPAAGNRVYSPGL